MKDEVRVRVPLCLEWSNNKIVGAKAKVMIEEPRSNQNAKKKVRKE